tara:strand:- start:528 stop:947 length:420 start_codon:yes stop_codon:yes gene_type:complete
MNAILLLIILIPVIEIYLFIQIGAKIGAFTTISLIFITAFVGVLYARYEGFNTLKSGLSQLVKNQVPMYEIISGAALAFAAILLIFPGFATDLIGLLIIFPLTRKLIFKKFDTQYHRQEVKKEDFIEGESEDIDDNKKP